VTSTNGSFGMERRSRGRPSRLPFAALIAAFFFLQLGSPSALAHQSPVGCTGSGLGIDLFAHVGDVHVGDTIRYSVRLFNSPFPACDATEIGAEIVTPDGITNSITALLRRNALPPGESDFYTNVVSYVVRAQDIRSDGTVRATALDAGTIHQNDTNSKGGGNQGVNTEVNLPCLQISALCIGGIGENGAIRFTGTVTNCGNSTLAGVTVTNLVDSGSFMVLMPTKLAIGQSVDFSGSWVPANPCGPNVALLTVRGTDEFTATPHTVTNFTTIACQNTLTPGIKVTKSCPVQAAAPGQMLVFSGTVANTGNVTLTNIVVLNDWPAPNTPVFLLASLAPGGVAPFTGQYAATTNCSMSDTLTANAQGLCGGAVTSSATATCPIFTRPALLVTQTCPVNAVLQGGILTYSGKVLNIGNTTLSNIVVVNDKPAAGTVIFTLASLAPGASAVFTGSYQVPSNCCVVSSTLLASGRGCNGALVAATC